jgi:hypothetical protein
VAYYARSRALQPFAVEQRLIRKMRPLVPLVVSVAVMASPAHAATWSPPETLSRTPHTFVGPLQAAAGPTGAAIATWPWQDGTAQHATTGASTAGRRPRGGAFGSERAGPAGLVAVGTFADSRTIALIETPAVGAQRMRLSVAYGSTTGSLGAGRTLRVAPILFRPQLAVNSHGSALFAWVEVVRSASGTRRIVRIAERVSSSASHPPVALPGRGDVQGLAIAVGDRGDAVVAVVRDGRLLGRVLTVGPRYRRQQDNMAAACGDRWTRHRPRGLAAPRVQPP